MVSAIIEIVVVAFACSPRNFAGSSSTTICLSVCLFRLFVCLLGFAFEQNPALLIFA